jgi:UDP-glucose 4-epimerase
MRVACTGSSGFIGRAVVTQLQAAGVDVVEIDRHNGHDILETDLAALLDPCDAVIHLAGILGTSELFDAIETAVDVNVHGTLRVLRACEKTGTGYVGITMPDCWPSVYQATKLAATRLAAAFHDTTGLPVTHVRAFNAYGPGQAHGPGHPQKIVPTFATKAWAGQPIPIWGNGSQTVDLVHVDHIAACLTSVALEPLGTGQTWDAGSGTELTVLEVAELVMEVTGATALEHLPMRAGETPGTRLCATNPGPFGYDTFSLTRLAETVESYR